MTTCWARLVSASHARMDDAEKRSPRIVSLSPEVNPGLLRMRDDCEDHVGVPVDLEVEAPPPCDPRLPDVLGLGVLLGPERGVAEILDEEAELLVESLLTW